jgi:SAM-dependent methyltransferase
MERDTAPEVTRRYHARIGALGGARRLEIAAQLTQGVRTLAEAGLRHRHPGASDEEVRCRLAALLYGRDVAERSSGSAPRGARGRELAGYELPDRAQRGEARAEERGSGSPPRFAGRPPAWQSFTSEAAAMKSNLLFRLLGLGGRAIAAQLSRPRGWLGRTVMTRALNVGNRELIEATLGGLPLSPDSRLLDVGFGGGLLLELAHRRGVRRLAGVDPSDAAVAFLRSRARLAGAELRVELGVAERLPFEDGSFDVVASTNTVYFWPDLAAAFRELRRVLRRGGVLTLGFSGNAKLRDFGEITRHGFHFHDEGALVAAAVAAGFTNVQLDALHGPVTKGDCVLRATA